MNKDNNRGIWVPLEIWKSADLSWNEKALLIEIHSHIDQDGECTLSNKQIEDLLGVSFRAASGYLHNLIALGFVTVLKFDGRSRWITTTESVNKLWQ